MDLEPLAAELAQLLVELSRVTRLAQRSESGCCGLTLAQCQLLLAVAQEPAGPNAPGCSQSEVAALLGLDLSTISRVADGLVRLGLLAKQVDSEDRRRYLLSLTPAGRECVQSISTGLSAYARRALEKLPVGDRQRVIESLRLLIGALQQAQQGGECCE